MTSENINQRSQFSFVHNPKGVKCIVYQEDHVTKTHDGGLKDMRREHKTVWIYPNKGNPNRCPVRLIEKYLNLCSPYHKKCNFYLQSLPKPTPNQWYGQQVVGQHTIAKVVQTLMKDAGIPGFFTNHSTRCTGGTRLFNAGVQRKLVKECTGHASDAIDKYQITSDEQREMLSSIIAHKHETNVTEKAHIAKNETKVEISPEVKVTVTQNEKLCTCGNVTSIKQQNVGDLVTEIVEKVGKDSKNVIKIQIEIIPQ